ncbi:MAG: translation initiation factor IF-2 [Mycobacterium leprae]
MDSKRVLEVLQTLNVDVKNHMSTIDQKTAEQVTEAAKRSPAAKKEAGGTAETTKAARPAATPKPAREANPAKSSLLDDFFGAGTKPRQRVEDMKRELRPTERPDTHTTERRTATPARPATEHRAEAHTAAEKHPVEAAAPAPKAEAPKAEAPKAEAPKAEAPKAEAPKAEAPKAEAPKVEASAVEAPAAEAAVAEAPKAKTTRARAPKAEAPKAEAPVAEAPVAEAVAVEAPKAEAPKAEAPVAEISPVDAPVAENTAQAAEEGAPAARPALPTGPAAERRGPGMAGGPSRPLPPGPAAAPSGITRPVGPRAMQASQGAPSGLGLPRPAGSTPVAPEVPPEEREAIIAGPRKPVAPVGGGGAVGLPSRPVGPIGGPRPAFDRGPRPAGPGGDRGPRPGGPRMGGGPGGPRPGGGGFGGRQRPGGQLNIPKVDPKVAEQAKPAENKRPIGQGGDRKKGDAFTKRETAASRPSEEKLFGRRPGGGLKPSLAERRSLKPITIEGALTVKDLAHEMGVTAAEVIKKLFTGFGIMATINQELDPDTCVLVAGEFGVEATIQEVENILDVYDEIEDAGEDEALKEPRHPVVTIMGHVDHGKTSLLDAIRSAHVAAGEAGGITQHIGAYEVELKGRKITFLDTPGHEAFTAMRARGANVTDIAILVVAADDSVMPQTIESINHAKAANVPVLVAINKIDKPGADPNKVKQDLTGYGLVAEEWGGETIMVPVSAKQQTNLDLLLENVLILADVLELKANPEKEAHGYILEAELDKNRGPVATVLVVSGTLNAGDSFVAGSAWGKVRAMTDHRGRKMKSAGPSTPVQVLGFQSVPAAGDVFRVAPDEKTARSIAEKRQAKAQAERQATKAVSLDDFMSAVAEGEVKDLNLIIKADVQGSVEALRGQLEKLRNEEVQVKIVHGAVGAITETDVMLARASNAIIIGFNVRPDDRAGRAASEQGIDIRMYNVIYNIIDDIKAAMTGMLAPKIEESILGRAEVRETFKVPKVGMAAGCMVVSGKITRNAKYRLIRDGVVVWNGEINALRRFKDEAKEVAEGYECGVTLEKFQDFKPGDILEAYELKEVKAG